MPHNAHNKNLQLLKDAKADKDAYLCIVAELLAGNLYVSKCYNKVYVHAIPKERH